MSTLSQQLAILRSNLDECEMHIKTLELGRKSSCAKSRALLMKIKKDSHTMRRDIMTHTKSLPTKKRGVSKKAEATVEKPEPEPEPVEEPKKRAPRKKKVVEPTE